MSTKTEKLRVVFTGHTGLLKSAAIDRLAAEFRRRHPTWNVSSYLAEAGIQNTSTFLKRSLPTQQDEWRRSVVSAINSWRHSNPRPDVAFLSLHLTYHWHNHIFSPLSWRLRSSPDAVDAGGSASPEFEDTLIKWVCETFQPHYFITLMDDIQAVQARIKTHTFRLRDLLKWRNIEIMMTDILSRRSSAPGSQVNEASFPYEFCPSVAIRHPATMLYRYLAEPKVLRVYTSFRISHIRRHKGAARKQMIAELDSFRSELNKRFTVFDPLTIDEIPIEIAYEEAKKKSQKKIIRVAAADQWQIPPAGTLCAEPRRTHDLALDDVKEIVTKASKAEKCELERHVEKRDFRMIDQADCVVIYRPTYGGGDWSRGTYHEALYAHATGKPLLVIHDPKDDGPLSSSALGIELAKEDYYEATPHLHKPNEQKKALAWLIRELDQRAPNWLKNRLGSNAP